MRRHLNTDTTETRSVKMVFFFYNVQLVIAFVNSSLYTVHQHHTVQLSDAVEKNDFKKNHMLYVAKPLTIVREEGLVVSNFGVVDDNLM